MLGQTMAPSSELASEDHEHLDAPPHNHDAVYSPTAHDHDGDYSPTTHDHDGDYSPTEHGHADLHNHEEGAIADGGGEIGYAYTQMLEAVTYDTTTFEPIPGLKKSVMMGDRPIMIAFETLVQSGGLQPALPVFQIWEEGSFLAEFTGTSVMQQFQFVNIHRSFRHIPGPGEKLYEIVMRVNNTSSGQSLVLAQNSRHSLRITEV